MQQSQYITLVEKERMNTFTQKQKEFLKKPILANISVIHSKTNLPLVFSAWVLELEEKYI